MSIIRKSVDKKSRLRSAERDFRLELEAWAERTAHTIVYWCWKRFSRKQLKTTLERQDSPVTPLLSE